MKIMWSEEIQEALGTTCLFATKYNVDITVRLYADGEVEVDVTPTYRDRPEQTDLLVKTPYKSRESHEKNCETCRDKDAYDEWEGNCDECENGSMYTPQTDV